MLRCIALALTCSGLSLAPAALADRTLKLYDLRDLAEVLPASDLAAGDAAPSDAALAAAKAAYTNAQAKVPILSDLPLVGTMFRIGTDASAQPDSPYRLSYLASLTQPTPPAQSPADKLLGTLCNVMTLTKEELVPGVYMVEGEDADHKRLADTLEQVRALYQDRVEIEVTCYSVDAQTSPAIGSVVPTNLPVAFRARSVSPRKTLAHVGATREVSYIARITPIVGDSSVGLEAGTATVRDGLEFLVRVTGTKESPRVSIRGSLTKARIDHATAPADQAMAGKNTSLCAQGSALNLGLPVIEQRTVRSDVKAEAGRQVVAAVVAGFEENKQILVAVSVKPVE